MPRRSVGSRKSADLRNDYALANLGRMYWLGRGGVATDRVEATKLWRKSAYYENERGRLYLAEALETGQGTAPDVEEAIELYKLVAAQDRDRDAQRRATEALRRLAVQTRLGAHEPDPVFGHNDILKGKEITQSQCAAIKYAVWVTHKFGTECIRYYPSANIERARLAVLYFHGDRSSGGKVVGAYRDNTVAAQLALAAQNAAENDVPWIMVARPGAYGSSGHHGARRQPKEFYSLKAAIDAIRAKHGIGRVILAGQSGGATSVGAVLTLGQTGVACGVATSGGYAVIERADRKRSANSPKRGLDSNGNANPYEPINEVAGIEPDARRRLFIIGDPRDANTYFDLQRKFAARVAAAGHHAVAVEARATGKSHHTLAPMAYKAAGWCAAGLSDDEIVSRIQADAPAIGKARSTASAPNSR